jgi:hypothetical protein
MAAAAANFKINELLQDGQVLSEFIEYWYLVYKTRAQYITHKKLACENHLYFKASICGSWPNCNEIFYTKTEKKRLVSKNSAVECRCFSLTTTVNVIAYFLYLLWCWSNRAMELKSCNFGYGFSLPVCGAPYGAPYVLAVSCFFRLHQILFNWDTWLRLC